MEGKSLLINLARKVKRSHNYDRFLIDTQFLKDANCAIKNIKMWGRSIKCRALYVFLSKLLSA